MGNQTMNSNSWMINLSSNLSITPEGKASPLQLVQSFFVFFLNVQVETENTSLWGKVDLFIIGHQATCFVRGFTSALTR